MAYTSTTSFNMLNLGSPTPEWGGGLGSPTPEWGGGASDWGGGGAGFGGASTRGGGSSSFGDSGGSSSRGGGSGSYDSGFANGGYVGEDPEDDYTVDPMQMVQSALDYGMRRITAGGEMSFEEGGVVPAQGMGNPNAIDPQAAMGYLAGDGAVSQEIAQALESRIDPQGTMNPTQRAMAAIGVVPNDEARFGMLQHYRTKFNGFAAAAKAAMSRGDMGEAARQATMAMGAVPNGQNQQFAPAPGGFAMASSPAIPRGRPMPSYEDGGEVVEYEQPYDASGEVMSDADPLYDESGAVVAPVPPEPPPEEPPPEPTVMSDADYEPAMTLDENGEPVQVAGKAGFPYGGNGGYSNTPKTPVPGRGVDDGAFRDWPTWTDRGGYVFNLANRADAERYRDIMGGFVGPLPPKGAWGGGTDLTGAQPGGPGSPVVPGHGRRYRDGTPSEVSPRGSSWIKPMRGYMDHPEELLVDPGRTSGPVGQPGPSGKAGYRDAEGNIMLPGATEPVFRRSPSGGYRYNDSAAAAPPRGEGALPPGGGVVGAGVVPTMTPRTPTMQMPMGGGGGGTSPIMRAPAVPPSQQPQQQAPAPRGDTAPVTSPVASPAARLRQPQNIDVGRGVRRAREGY